MLGVALIVFETAAEAAGADEHLARFSGVTVRFFAGKGFAGYFLDDTFADADSGNQELANVEVAAEDDEDDGGYAHDVGAIAADAVGFHALANITFQNIGETLT